MGSSKKTFQIVLHVDVANMVKSLFNGKDRRYENPTRAVNDLLKAHYDINETAAGQYSHLSLRAVGGEVMQIDDGIRQTVAEIIVTLNHIDKTT